MQTAIRIPAANDQAGNLKQVMGMILASLATANTLAGIKGYFAIA